MGTITASGLAPGRAVSTAVATTHDTKFSRWQACLANLIGMVSRYYLYGTYYFKVLIVGSNLEYPGTAVPGHVRPTGTDSLRHVPTKFRNNLRLISTFHILSSQYVKSTNKA